MKRLPPNQPDRCRLCGDPTWLVDDTGGVHPCCIRWADELAAGRPCISCEASRANQRKRSRSA